MWEETQRIIWFSSAGHADRSQYLIKSTKTLNYQVQALGFSGEIGYQSFLYPSEREVSSIFSAQLTYSIPKLNLKILISLIVSPIFDPGSQPPLVLDRKVASNGGRCRSRHRAADHSCKKADRGGN